MKTLITFLHVLVGVLVIAAVGGKVGAAGGFVLLVNKSNAKAALSKAELAQMLSGTTKQWDSGAIVHLGLIPSDAPETGYIASLLGSTAADLLGRVQQQIFKGEMRRPAMLKSSQDCLAFAGSDPGALCVVSDALPLSAAVRAVPFK